MSGWFIAGAQIAAACMWTYSGHQLARDRALSAFLGAVCATGLTMFVLAKALPI